MSALSYQIESWNTVTGLLPWGVQRVLKDALQLVADEKITMCHGVDSYAGSPCLVNAINPLISNHAVNPAKAYPMLVSVFDLFNTEFNKQVPTNDPWLVSPIAAETLVRNFGSLQPKPEVTEYTEQTIAETLARLERESLAPETAEEVTAEETS